MSAISITPPRAKWWTALAALDALLFVAAAFHAGKYFQPFYDFEGIVIVLAGALGIGILGVTVGACAVFWKPARRYFLATITAAAFLLVLAYSCHLFQRASFFIPYEQARNYMAVARPALDSYLQENGHYPESLRQLHLSLQPPGGMTYARDHDFFSVTFGDAIYCQDGYWFRDD
jgi:hypothetical protein